MQRGLIFSLCWLLACSLLLAERSASANEITTRHVRQSIGLGLQYLMNQQRHDGSFPADEVLTHPVGVTCVATLALRATEVAEANGPIEKSLAFLRAAEWQTLPTHELALLTMTLVDAETLGNFNQTADQELISRLVHELQSRQEPDGSWWNKSGNVENGLRISYLAVLALRDASLAGYRVEPNVWQQVQSYWRASQNTNGSWGTIADKPLLLQENSHLSLAGRTRHAVGTLALCRQMLQMSRYAERGLSNCCDETPADSAALRGQVWLEQEISRWKTEQRSQSFLQYHLYALEKTGQYLSVQLSDEQDLYLSGTRTLLIQQDRRTGHWEGNNRVLATSYAMLFLSKALKPVLAQKLLNIPITGSANAANDTDNSSPENQPLTTPLSSQEKHPQDLVDLTNWLTTLAGWPTGLNCQEIRLDGKSVEQGLKQLLQAPVLYVTGESALRAGPQEVLMLREYLQQGGVLIAAPVCQSAEFEKSFQELIRQIDPGAGELVPLSGNHPVYWMEFELKPEDCEIWGLDSGCRTPVFYCPQDLGCYWSQASLLRKKKNSETTNNHIEAPAPLTVALKMGANLIAYATAKNVPNRFESVAPDNLLQETKPSPRGSFRVAELHHEHRPQTDSTPINSSPAPRIRPSKALQRMAEAAAQSAEITVSVHPQKVTLQQEELFPFPVLYIHGRQPLRFSAKEKQALRQYLDRGGILFCDASCGSVEFDRSFRDLMHEFYPDSSLESIPSQCELFTEEIGHDLKSVEFHHWNYDTQAKKMASAVKIIPPVLEGIQRNGMYFVFYSRYDLGCALEEVSQTTCEGYTPASAAKIATNVLLYSLLQ